MDQQMPPAGQDGQKQEPKDKQPAQSQNQTPPKKYGKWPTWVWVLLYVVLGTVIYLLIYFFFFADTAGDSGIYG